MSDPHSWQKPFVLDVEQVKEEPVEDESKSLETQEKVGPDDTESFQFRKPSLLLIGFLIFFVGMLGFESAWFVEEMLERSLIIGSIFLVLYVGVVVGLSRTIYREWKGSQSLKRREKQRAQEAFLRSDASFGKATGFVYKLHQGLNDNSLNVEWEQYQNSIHDTHNDGEILKIYSEMVLSELDLRVKKRISKYSGEAAVMIALSPIALLDVLLIVWRNLRMIREIAQIYGCEFGVMGNLRLLKMVAGNMIYAGTSEFLTDAGVDLAGSAMSAAMSAKVAQGLGAGVLTARLGLQAMRVCRPLKAEGEAALTVSQYRRELVQHLKTHIVSWLTKKTKDKVNSKIL